MDFDLPDDHELLRRTVRDFAEGEVAPVAEELDRTHAFPYEIVRKLGDLGLMGIPFPEEYGGAGADTLAYALAVEELTRVDSSVAITLFAHTSLGTQPIYLFGSEEQKRDFGPVLAKAKTIKEKRRQVMSVNETWYAVRGVLTQKQLDRLPPQVYAELQLFDPATSTWSEYGIETADGCVARNPPFDEMAKQMQQIAEECRDRRTITQPGEATS